MADNNGWLPPTGSSASATPDSNGWLPPTGNTAAVTQVKQQTAPPAAEPGILSKVGSFAGDVATGFGKGVLDTTSGIGAAIQKIPGVGPAIIPQSGLAAEESAAKTDGSLGQNIGKVGENVAEFAAGEEGLKSLSTFAKVAQNSPQLIALLEKYPTSAKIIMGALKGGTVGAAQGAVKGAATKEGAVKGAEGGAAGGALGGAVGGAFDENDVAGKASASLAQKVAKTLGIGGQSFESAMSKAGRPAVADRNWKDSLELAEPIILDNIDPKTVKSIDDFVDQVGDVKNQLWENDFKKPVDKWKNAPVTTTPIATQIQNTITRSMKKHFPEDAAEMERMSNNFVGNSTIGELAEDLQTFNAKLKGYWKMDPQARAAAGKTDGEIAGLEQAADGMRDLLIKELEARGEDISEVGKQYGALADIERIFTKRIPVADRQGPLNLAQILSMAGGAGEAVNAIRSGHPLEAVAAGVPMAAATVAKMRSAPESLIRQGLKAGAAEGTGPSVAGAAARTAVGAAGAQAGQSDWIKVIASDGQGYHVHPDDLAEMQKRDPGVKVVPDDSGSGTPTVTPSKE